MVNGDLQLHQDYASVCKESMAESTDSERPSEPLTRHIPQLGTSNTEFDCEGAKKSLLCIDDYYCGDGGKIDLPVPEKTDHRIAPLGVMLSGGVYLIWSDGQKFARKHCYTRCDYSDIFKKELDILQSFRSDPHPHRHVVQLMNYYSSPDGGESGLVLSPAADFDLKVFLQSMHVSTEDSLFPWKKRFIERSYGCLAAALKYIHAKGIKHKDIKPQNLLVHGNDIIIADFGISNPCRAEDHSTTTGPNPGSQQHKAPEALDEEPRGRKQDMWSLMCVYLELETCRLGLPLETFITFCKESYGGVIFAKVFDKLQLWIHKLRDEHMNSENPVILDIIFEGLQLEPYRRFTAAALFKRVDGLGERFVGECCSSAGSHASTECSVRVNIPSPNELKSSNGHPVAYFLASAVVRIEERCYLAPVKILMEEAFVHVLKDDCASLRALEVKLLQYIAPARCETADAYLEFYNVFTSVLIDAIASGEFKECLTTEGLEAPYTLSYFEALTDIIFRICRVHLGATTLRDSSQHHFLKSAPLGPQ
ncbi:MAG: hypothetical protein M1827_005782 [Pycnora praestabilis]|nr:MAG: hypothetical protein M1827_005782 [Pycnora praestabilis]